MRTRISERKVILFTIGLIVFAGLTRLLSYPVGNVLLYAAFAPYIVYRTFYFLSRRKQGLTTTDKYRLFVLITLVVTFLLNTVGWQQADFFLIFLIMLDLLIVLHQRQP